VPVQNVGKSACPKWVLGQRGNVRVQNPDDAQRVNFLRSLRSDCSAASVFREPLSVVAVLRSFVEVRSCIHPGPCVPSSPPWFQHSRSALPPRPWAKSPGSKRTRGPRRTVPGRSMSWTCMPRVPAKRIAFWSCGTQLLTCRDRRFTRQTTRRWRRRCGCARTTRTRA